MICPLTASQVSTKREGVTLTTQGGLNCIEKECAWWNISKGKCAILSIAEKLDKIKVSK